MPTLKIANNSAQNPITVDLSGYLKLADDGGVDPADPNFTQRIFARSLLKEGATLALQQLVEKEQQWPMLLGPYANQSQMMAAIAQINQVINTPGAVLSWQDDGTSQPTDFDLLSGELQIEYSYRKGQRSYTAAKLLTFSQPLGRTAAARPYATASGIGPLLMISPYASGGALAIGASTQAGVAGFGGAPAGPSSGVFYPGAPSLAGDAKALLQVSYVGPLPIGATNAGCVPQVAVSLLPDPYYNPLVTVSDMTWVGASSFKSSTAVASQYVTSFGAVGGGVMAFAPLRGPSTAALDPASLWAGAHRVFALARASGTFGGSLQLLKNSLSAPAAAAPVTTWDWALYDLGTFTLRASEPPTQAVQVAAVVGVAAAVDVTAFFTLPDNATWFLAPSQVTPSQYGFPNGLAQLAPGVASAPYTNTFLLDNVLSDQFLYSGQSQTFAPSPIGAVPSSARVTQFSRGLVPSPDPKNGLPIIAIISAAQSSVPSATWTNAFGNTVQQNGASWSSAQNLRTMAQVNVLERARYVLP